MNNQKEDVSVLKVKNSFDQPPNIIYEKLALYLGSGYCRIFMWLV